MPSAVADSHQRREGKHVQEPTDSICVWSDCGPHFSPSSVHSAVQQMDTQTERGGGRGGGGGARRRKDSVCRNISVSRKKPRSEEIYLFEERNHCVKKYIGFKKETKV